MPTQAHRPAAAPIRLSTLLQGLGQLTPRVQPPRVQSPLRGDADPLITGVTEDSRRVTRGSLFVARPARVGRAQPGRDGASFLGDALVRGCAAVLAPPGVSLPSASSAALLTCDDVPTVGALLAERSMDNPSSRLSLVGVTGTNGKTTITFLIRHLLEASGIAAGVLGTTGLWMPGVREPGALTTPPAEDVSSVLRRMVDVGCGAAAIEVSSHALDQRRVAGLRFRIGVFTNLTGDHLDYHGSMEAYAQAKAELFAMLPAQGLAVLNGDDDWHAVMAARCRGAQIVRCHVRMGEVGDGRPRGAGEAWAFVRSMSAEGAVAQLVGPFGELDAHWPLVGMHNTMNMLQAAVVAHALGVDGPRLRAAFRTAPSPPGRLERVTPVDHLFHVFVDYAHTDDALDKVLRAARPLVGGGGRLVAVFGCGGDRDRTKRSRMGRVARELADLVVVTSDNPRTENPEQIIEQILAGITPRPEPGTLHVEPDRAAAIASSIALARRGDVIVIAGKGHEDYQILPDPKGGTVRIHFDDREQARAALSYTAGASR